MEVVSVYAVQSSEYAELARATYRRQRACYQRFGVARAADAQASFLWRNVTLVVAEDARGELVGGLRVHRRGAHALPAEAALAGQTRLSEHLERRRGGVVEYAGLWVEERLRGRGLSAMLVSLGIAITPELGARHGVAFTHHHLDFWCPFGFDVDARLQGLAYPSPSYRSSLLWIDALDVPNAAPYIRGVISRLRHAARERAAVRWRPGPGSLPDQIEFPRRAAQMVRCA